MFTHVYNIIIDCGVREPGSFKEVVDGLNDIDKTFFSMFMTNVKLPGASGYDTHMETHTSTQ